MNYKSILKITVCALLCFVLAFSFTACGEKEEGVPDSNVIKLGDMNAQYDFRLLVMIDDEVYRAYSIHTDEFLLGDALENNDLIKVVKDSKKFGTYTKTVAGKTFDPEKDGKCWMLSAEHCPATSNPYVVDIICGTTYIYEADDVKK